MDGYKIIAYLADWADWKVQDVDAKKLTHINYAFATIEDGRVVAKVLDRNLGKFHLLKEIKAQNPHLKTLISIGGWEPMVFRCSSDRGFKGAVRRYCSGIHEGI